jgi:UDP-N-acetylglucosamine 2-epimerase (non-hydrolysing)
MKIVFLGTRPEVIKLAPVIKLLGKSCIVVNTGQQKHLASDALEEFGIVPDIICDLMESGESLFDSVAKLQNKAFEIIQSLSPGLVIVQGDTSTAYAAAFAAFLAGVKVAHVEAGLRSYDNQNPYPEEFFRSAISRMADLHFVPTIPAKENLLREGINEGIIHLTGNTVIDSLKNTLNEFDSNPELQHEIINHFSSLEVDLNRKYILLTFHRRENFGAGISNIYNAVRILAKKHPEVDFIYPVHLNPNIADIVQDEFKGCTNVKLIPPQRYKRFIYLLKNTEFVISDSGGLQEECTFLGKFIIVTRRVTERSETLGKFSVLTGVDINTIIAVSEKILDENDKNYINESEKLIFGKGDSARKIYALLSKFV